MPIGDYRDWVLILPRATATPDATGEAVESWPNPPTDATPHAAAIEGPAGGNETSNPRHATQTLRLRFRGLHTLAARDRVQFRDTSLVFNVVGVWRERAKEGRGFQTVCDLLGPVTWLQ